MNGGGNGNGNAAGHVLSTMFLALCGRCVTSSMLMPVVLFSPT